MDHVAVLVTQDLDLDVLGLHQVFFNKDVVVAKGLPGLALDQLEGGFDLLRGVAAAHAPAAAAGGRLEDDGEAVGDGLLQGLVSALQGLSGAGDGGDVAGQGSSLGGQLVTHLGQDLGAGADEGDTGILTGLGELGVLREEPVAGVDGVHMSALGQIDDTGDVQIGPQGGFALADAVGLVSPGAEQGEGVLIGVHGHRVQTQVVAGPEDPDGNFAPVGHQDLVKLTLCQCCPSFLNKSCHKLSKK